MKKGRHRRFEEARSMKRMFDYLLFEKDNLHFHHHHQVKQNHQHNDSDDSDEEEELEDEEEAEGAEPKY